MIIQNVSQTHTKILIGIQWKLNHTNWNLILALAIQEKFQNNTIIDIDEW